MKGKTVVENLDMCKEFCTWKIDEKLNGNQHKESRSKENEEYGSEEMWNVVIKEERKEIVMQFPYKCGKKMKYTL